MFRLLRIFLRSLAQKHSIYSRPLSAAESSVATGPIAHMPLFSIFSIARLPHLGAQPAVAEDHTVSRRIQWPEPASPIASADPVCRVEVRPAVFPPENLAENIRVK
jgi:hypothetical protein